MPDIKYEKSELTKEEEHRKSGDKSTIKNVNKEFH